MRADRLVSILLLLQSAGRLSARELADRLEVSERTIHRDMEALGAAGIPVYAERGPAGGWRLAEGYRSGLTGMTTDEIRALWLLQTSSVVRELDAGGDAGLALRKLLSALPGAARADAERARERIHIDGASWRASAEAAVHLQTVQEAVWNERLLRIRYASPDKPGAASRLIGPLGLVAKRQIWYTVALTDGEIRVYRVSRIREAELTEERFERPAGFDLAGYWEASTADFIRRLPQYPTRVLVRPEALPLLAAERFVDVSPGERREDGWIEAEVRFDTAEQACRVLLGYGAAVRAEEPDELREAIVRGAARTLSLYGKLTWIDHSADNDDVNIEQGDGTR